MSQLTRRDLEEVLEAQFKVFEERMDRKWEEKLDRKLDEKLERQLNEKLDEKLGAFVQHLDDKFDSLAEALSLMNTTMSTLARQSDLDEVKRDIRTIKFAVTETNRDLCRLDHRFDKLEDRLERLERSWSAS